MSHNAALGKYGEELATEYLRKQGMAILARNWRCDVGEIDIVARDGNVLVICEVKTRSRSDFGAPLEAITSAKADRLRRLAACWLRANRTPSVEVRIDVVGIVGTGAQAELQHVKGVLG